MALEKEKKKTPSARVIAASLVSLALTHGKNKSREEMAALFSSRVNEKKAEKVKEQYGKLVDKFHDRMKKILDKFENPPVKTAGSGKKPNFGKKK